MGLSGLSGMSGLSGIMGGGNVPPVITKPSAQSVEAGLQKVFSSGNSNAISVADAEGGDLTLTLSASSGKLWLGRYRFENASGSDNHFWRITVPVTVGSFTLTYDGDTINNLTSGSISTAQLQHYLWTALGATPLGGAAIASFVVTATGTTGDITFFDTDNSSVVTWQVGDNLAAVQAAWDSSLGADEVTISGTDWSSFTVTYNYAGQHANWAFSTASGDGNASTSSYSNGSWGTLSECSTSSDAGLRTFTISLVNTVVGRSLASTSLTSSDLYPDVTFSAGDGINDATMTVVGTASNINTLLEGLMYAPDTYTATSDTLSISLTDSGSLLDSETVALTVTHLLRDSFTDTNSTALASHTPEEGGSWSATSGNLQINTNRAVVTSAPAVGAQTLSLADFTVQGNVQGSNTGFNSTGAIALRIKASNSTWIFAQGEVSSSRFRLYRRNAGGSHTQLGEATISLSYNTDYLVKIVAIADSLVATLDGGNTISVTETMNQSETTVGIRGDGTGCKVSDIIAWRNP